MEFFYWKKFAESGNVLDYLNYKQVQKSKSFQARKSIMSESEPIKR